MPKISQLPLADTPLSGDELIPIVQFGDTCKIHLSEILEWFNSVNNGGNGTVIFDGTSMQPSSNTVSVINVPGDYQITPISGDFNDIGNNVTVSISGTGYISCSPILDLTPVTFTVSAAEVQAGGLLVFAQIQGWFACELSVARV